MRRALTMAGATAVGMAAGGNPRWCNELKKSPVDPRRGFLLPDAREVAGRLREIPRRFSLAFRCRPTPLTPLSLNPTPSPARPARVLSIIVLAQFAGTAAAAVSAVQLGLIVSALLTSLLRVADLLPPARLFVLCAVVGSGLNAGLLPPGATPRLRLVLRFGTGLFLVGIYLVGMKIAVDYFENGLGRGVGPVRCGGAAPGAGLFRAHVGAVCSPGCATAAGHPRAPAPGPAGVWPGAVAW